jgi:hypothetical protein
MNWKISSIIGGFLLLILIVNASLRYLREENAKKAGITETNGKEDSRFSPAGPIHEITPTLEEITNGTFRFFRQNGEPLVGFSGKNGGLKIYSKPNGTDPFGNDVTPATREIVVQLTKIIQERTNAEIRRFRENELVRAKEEAERNRIARSNEVFHAQERDLIARSNEVFRLGFEEDRKRVAHSNEVVKAAADLVAYRDHYISSLAKYSLAVLVVDEHDNPNAPVSSDCATLFRRSGLSTSPGLFKPAFIKDGLFNEAFTGQSDALNRLPLTNAASWLFLGHQSVTYSTNSELGNLITANMTFQITAISTATMQASYTKSFQAYGPGATLAEARGLAQDRCFEQLTNGPMKAISGMILESIK